MRRVFYTSMSPSMDILLSNNLERLLYLVAGDEKVCLWMRQLREQKFYSVDEATKKALQSEFIAYYASEENTVGTIKSVWDNDKYLIDTHTAVGAYCASLYMKEKDYTPAPMLIASTASPFKFASDVYKSLTGETCSSLAAADKLSALTLSPIPAPLSGLEKRPVNFTETVSPEAMPDSVRKFAL